MSKSGLKRMNSRYFVLFSALALGLALAGCSPMGRVDSGLPLTVGQTTQLQNMDPMATYSSSDFEVMYQVYPTVLNSLPSDNQLFGDVALDFGYVAPLEYRVSIKDGLRFANGNALTASDVAFSMNRLLETEEPGGPQVLLKNVVRAEVVDELTAIYHLREPYDQTLPYILSSVPGLVLDEEVFPIDKPLTVQQIIDAQPFAGPYIIDAWQEDEFLSLMPNEAYQGLWGPARNSGVIVRYFENYDNLLLSVEEEELDVALLFRSASVSRAEFLAQNGEYRVESGAGAEPGFLSLNLATQPYGTLTPEADSNKALLIRQAISKIVDREELSENAYLGHYQPAYSTVPSAVFGSRPTFRELYSGFDASAVKQQLVKNGISIPIPISLSFSPERYGEDGGKLPFLIESQLERDGIFEVDLVPLDWATLREVRKTDDYQMVLLFWGPDFEDPDNYLSPLLSEDGWLFNHYSNTQVTELLAVQKAQEDPSARKKTLGEIQLLAARDAAVIPLLEGGRSALVRVDVKGVKETLDASFKLRYSFFSR